MRPRRILWLAAASLASAAIAPAQTTQVICARQLQDQFTQACIVASSLPAMGALYPLSVDFNLDTAGQVGIGTTTPVAKLQVDGDGAAGQAPLRVDRNGIPRLLVDTDGLVSVGEGLPLPIPPKELTVSGRLEARAAGLFDSAVEGYATNPAGSNYGGYFRTEGDQGKGVYAAAVSSTGATTGVHAQALSPDGAGVRAYHTASTGSAGAIEAWTNSSSGNAVVATAASTSASGSNAVFAWNKGTGNNCIGVFARVDGSGIGGRFNAGSGGIGCLGSAPNDGDAVLALGNMSATGTKSFVQPHPTDPTKEVRFVCLEGNESGTYFRGSGRVVGGRAVIEVPEEFRLVSEEDGLTVQITVIGAPVLVWVESKDLQRVVVRADVDVDFDYFVNGVRRGFADVEIVRPNRAFVPQYRDEPFGRELPPDARRILVDNGTLNPDFTPNELTAAHAGWTLRDRPEESPRPPAEALRPAGVGGPDHD